MKKLLFILLCVPLMFTCGGGDKEKKEKLEVVQITDEERGDLIEQFTIDLERNLEAANNRDFNVSIDMTYPKLFDYISKEQLVEVFESMFDIYSDIKMRASNIRDLHPIINYEGLQFTRFFYDNEMVLTFHDRDGFDEIFSSLSDEFGEDNVKSSWNTNSMTVSGEASIIAVLQENSSEWKYLQWDKDLFQQFEVIPTSVLEQLRN